MIISQTKELAELFKGENLEIPHQALKENDLVIVPSRWSNHKQYFDYSIVPVLKELRVKIPKTEIYSTKTIVYRDF